MQEHQEDIACSRNKHIPTIVSVFGDEKNPLQQLDVLDDDVFIENKSL